jgi:hypothetical protein
MIFCDTGIFLDEWRVYADQALLILKILQAVEFWDFPTAQSFIFAAPTP